MLFKHLNQALQQLQLSLFDAEPPQPVAPAPVIAPSPAEPPRSAGVSRRELLLDGQPVAYSLRRARRRSIGFSVAAEGLSVAAPRWVTIGEIERALQAKADWILRKLVEQRERERRLQAAAVVWGDGCSLPYLGEPMTVRLAPGLAGRARFDDESRHLHLALTHAAGTDELRAAVQSWLQRQARGHFEQRCQHYAAALGVSYTRLSLSSAQTRWGSANANGAIRLNWRLIHFAPPVIDYVVAHELAHLREMNHSARFWAVVRSVVPDYEQARRQLRDELLPRL
jgi:predicted metal-dependent hydrolase